MIKYLRNLKSAALKNKICLLRLDFNTEDNWRMEASLPTVKYLSRACKAVVILSHWGRPEGFDKNFSLAGKAKIFSKMLKKRIIFVRHFRFKEIGDLARTSPKGTIFLLENLRFLPSEGENNFVLAEHLASLGDFYVNDAFAVSHRANASVVAITEFLPSYAGFELESEIRNLSAIIKSPKKPLVVILGGLKIEDKLKVIENLQDRAAAFLVGGALTPELMKKLESNKKIVLAVDFTKNGGGVIRDIGPETVKSFQKEIARAKTVIWNGPLGDINQKQYEVGTKVIVRAVAANKKAFKVIGGGETVMYFKRLKLDKKIDFISTGGGAMLDFLAGKKLPGIVAFEGEPRQRREALNN